MGFVMHSRGVESDGAIKMGYVQMDMEALRGGLRASRFGKRSWSR